VKHVDRSHRRSGSGRVGNRLRGSRTCCSQTQPRVVAPLRAMAAYDGASGDRHEVGRWIAGCMRDVDINQRGSASVFPRETAAEYLRVWDVRAKGFPDLGIPAVHDHADYFLFKASTGENCAGFRRYGPVRRLFLPVDHHGCEVRTRKKHSNLGGGDCLHRQCPRQIMRQRKSGCATIHVSIVKLDA
jgi:hypothetical protein